MGADMATLMAIGRAAHVTTVYKEVSVSVAVSIYVRSMRRAISFLFVALMASQSVAHDATVVEVRVEKAGMLWNFHVTVEHEDTGWDHYADGWEVQDADGNRLAYRKLLHPHVEEQPFTRSLSGVVIPDGTQAVFVRAHCSQTGWSSSLVKVDLSQ